MATKLLVTAPPTMSPQNLSRRITNPPTRSFNQNLSWFMKNPSSRRNLITTLTTTRTKKKSSHVLMKSSLSPASNPITSDSVPDPQLLERCEKIGRLEGKTIVIKYSNAALEFSSLAFDLVVLSNFLDLHFVLVHESKTHTKARQLQQEIQAHDLNEFDSYMLSTILASKDKINRRLVALINETGRAAVGLSSVDGYFPNPSSIIHYLFKFNCIPVIACVSTQENEHQYHIDADQLAGDLATSLGAAKLIYFTEEAGILEVKDNPDSTLLKELNETMVAELIKDDRISVGLISKVLSSSLSIARGVGSASIVHGRYKHSLPFEVLNYGRGTKITA